MGKGVRSGRKRSDFIQRTTVVLEPVRPQYFSEYQKEWSFKYTVSHMHKSVIKRSCLTKHSMVAMQL